MRDRLFLPYSKDSEISLRNYVFPRINQETKAIEKHLPLANYAGPGTDIVRRLNEHVIPTTKTDKATQQHDITYYNIRSSLRDHTLSIPDAKKAVRASDNLLISEAKKNLGRGPVNTAHALGTLAGIKAKEKIEDFGIIDELKFVGAGIRDPFKKLRTHMVKPSNKKGG